MFSSSSTTRSVVLRSPDEGALSLPLSRDLALSAAVGISGFLILRTTNRAFAHDAPYGGHVAVNDYSRTRLLNSSVKLQRAWAVRRRRRARRAVCGERPRGFLRRCRQGQTRSAAHA